MPWVQFPALKKKVVSGYFHKYHFIFSHSRDNSCSIPHLRKGVPETQGVKHPEAVKRAGVGGCMRSPGSRPCTVYISIFCWFHYSFLLLTMLSCYHRLIPPGTVCRWFCLEVSGIEWFMSSPLIDRWDSYASDQPFDYFLHTYIPQLVHQATC